MALNKRNMDKISALCGDDDAMLGFMRDIITHEIMGNKQYTKAYKDALRKRAAQREEDRA